MSQINFEDETLDASDGVTRLLLAAEYWKEKASALLAKITEMEKTMFDPDEYELHEAQKHACRMAKERDEARVVADRLTAELAQCAALLPGAYYMDPPDGGDVPISEQLRRMAKDAERYRFLRAAKHIPISSKAARDPIVYDAAIDAAMLAAAEQVDPNAI